MWCEICNAKLNKRQTTLCDTCRETISRLTLIQARSEQTNYPDLKLAQAADPDDTATVAFYRDTPPVSREEAPASSTPPNPYWEGSAIAGMYEILSDGKWHSIDTLRNRFKVDVEKRLHSIRRRGEKESAWDLEVSQDQVRLAPKK